MGLNAELPSRLSLSAGQYHRCVDCPVNANRMTKMLTYNRALSVKLAKRLGGMIEVKRCYDNVYKVLTEAMDILPDRSKTRILFCYLPTAGNLYVRHVMVVYDGQLVEPLLHIDLEKREVERIIPIRELSFDEYFSLLLKEGKSDLEQALLNDELEVFNVGNFTLNPIDLGGLITRLAKTQDDYFKIVEILNNGGRLEIPA